MSICESNLCEKGVCEINEIATTTKKTKLECLEEISLASTAIFSQSYLKFVFREHELNINLNF